MDGWAKRVRRSPGWISLGHGVALVWSVFLWKSTSSAANGTVRGPSRARQLIVQGQEADTTKYSYFALSANDAYASTVDNVCGAALIHSDILLTAGHCHGLFNYGVWLYNPTTKQFDRLMRVVEQWRHPNFNLDNSNYNWDLLVLRLEEPVSDIQPVVFNNNPNFPSTDELLEAVGFGSTDFVGEMSNVLLVGELQYMSPRICADRLSTFAITGAVMGDELLCAESTDAGNSICLGDSGGPLLANGVLVGITSWTMRCEVDQIPDGFARISAMSDWVQERICQISTEIPSSCPVQGPISSMSMIEMRLEFRHDFSPEDTTFAVRNKVSGVIEYAGPTYVVSDRESSNIWLSTFQLPEGEYTFEVYDREKNGLSDTQHTVKGAWQLYAKRMDGSNDFDLVASGDHDFLEESIASFQIILPDILPTLQSPSATPTATLPADSPSETQASIPPQPQLPTTKETSTQGSELARTNSVRKGYVALLAILLFVFLSCGILVRFRFSPWFWSVFVKIFDRCPWPTTLLESICSPISKRLSSGHNDDDSTNPIPKESKPTPYPDGLPEQYTATLSSGST